MMETARAGPRPAGEKQQLGGGRAGGGQQRHGAAAQPQLRRGGGSDVAVAAAAAAAVARGSDLLVASAASAAPIVPLVATPLEVGRVWHSYLPSAMAAGFVVSPPAAAADAVVPAFDAVRRNR
jgi:hypothetical protein